MRRAFTVIELLIVIAIIGVLLGFLLPALERVRHKGYIQACGSNLHQLGVALTIYANANRGRLPRTRYVAGASPVAGTGSAATDPFSISGPSANDVTAPLWLLIRVCRLPTLLLICPYNDVNEFAADRSLPMDHSNFADYRKNLGYSYANPYPATASADRTMPKRSAEFAVMADLNPGVSDVRKADPFRPTSLSAASDMAFGNSENHEREGQNVLFADGHVVYATTPFVGIGGDNIYTARSAVRPTIMAAPADEADSILLPPD